jgi:radical SAM superfamily enzyme YgiQ (UPF0313 family)
LKAIKVTLIFPRFRIKSGDPPLGLAYVAAYARKYTSAQISVFDATFTPSFAKLKRFLARERPDIAGIYSDTMMSPDAVRVAKICRKIGVFTVAGGPHPTILPETIINDFDLAVIGEGEKTFAEIINRFESRDFEAINGLAFKQGGEMFKTPPMAPIEDLDSLPFPAWDLVPMRKYLSSWHYLDSHDTSIKGANIIGSRGCPFDCTYCQPTLRSIFGTRIRFHSAGYLADEIEHLVKTYGINGIFFHDDTFTVNRKWLIDVGHEIIKRKIKIRWGINSRVDTIEPSSLEAMRDAGLTAVHLGAESGNQRILDNIYHKGITVEQTRSAVYAVKKAGIHCFCFFMIGAPAETTKEIWRTIRFALSLPIDEASFSITTPLPQTHLYEMVHKNPAYSITGGYSGLNYYSRRSFKDPGLSNIRLQAYHLIALAMFYGRPRKIAYMLRHLRSWSGAVKLARKILRNI